MSEPWAEHRLWGLRGERAEIAYEINNRSGIWLLRTNTGDKGNVEQLPPPPPEKETDWQPAHRHARGAAPPLEAPGPCIFSLGLLEETAK